MNLKRVWTESRDVRTILIVASIILVIVLIYP